MEKLDRTQKKKIVFSVLYAILVGLLVVACAVTIVMVNKEQKVDSTPNLNIGEENTVVVATPSYVVPMKDATIVKDYSATELQYNDSLKQWEIHKAIDFKAGESLDVYAVTDGTVSNIYTNYLEGTVVEITHSNGLVSVYKSLENSTVAIGDKVGAGQVIGQAGETMAQEQNQGKHLHFEMIKNGKKVNPNDYLDLGSK